MLFQALFRVRLFKVTHRGALSGLVLFIFSKGLFMVDKSKKHDLSGQNDIDHKALIQTNLDKAGIEYSAEQLNSLATVIDMLKEWSKSLNLTAISSVHDLVILHIIDSAVIVPVVHAELLKLKPNGDNYIVADVGTGAGFPGLVLAIMLPHVKFTLIDSVGKKLSFVRMVVAKLGLKNVELINKRCESIKHEPFDVIVSRAFAPIERMVNWCLPLLSQDGRFVAMKANLSDDEMNAIPKSVEVEQIIKLNVPSLDAVRNAVILKKS